MTNAVIIIVPCWRREVNITKGIYLPLFPALLSDLILVATKLLAYTGYLLQSLRHREEETGRHNETCWTGRCVLLEHKYNLKLR